MFRIWAEDEVTLRNSRPVNVTRQDRMGIKWGLEAGVLKG
jgi:hypothetical protein